MQTPVSPHGSVSLGPIDMDWEESDCPLCAGRDWTPVIEAPDPDKNGGTLFVVVRCRACDLCFTNPRPSPGAIARFYPDDYKPHFKNCENRPERMQWWRRWLPFPRFRSPRRHLIAQGQSRLLDFGCGGGSYLLRMRSRGWKVVGIDTSPATVERLRSEFKLEVHHGTLPHPALPPPALAPNSFDLVTMWQSLEHVHRPLEVLQAAHGLLAPGGKIIVALHNIESLPFRWFGRAWFPLDLPRHLTHFSPTTLRRMLQRAGFEAAEVRMVRSSAWLRHSARLAKRFQARRGPLPAILGTRLGSNLASWYCCLRRMSDSILATACKPASASSGQRNSL